MPDITPNIGLKKPLGNERVTRAAYNENLDIMDANAVKKGSGIAELTGGTLADRPAAGEVGRYYFAQDTGAIYLDTGSEWIMAAASQVDLTGLQNEVSSHLAETAPHAEETDRTITVGADKDFTTIQAAIDSLKKRVDATITINIDAGTYAEDVVIAGFVGSGFIYVYGGSDLVTSVNFIVNSFRIDLCTAFVQIGGFKSVSTTKVGFYMNTCIRVRFIYCTCTTPSSIEGVFGNSGLLQVDTCEISNRSIGICGIYMSVIYSYQNSGSGNTIGLRAFSGATISKDGTQPQGTTAEQVTAGGVIR